MTAGNDKSTLGITVVIPAYNVEAFIGRALDSVLAQTRAADEIIVVDDGSTDHTREVVERYEAVRYVHQENAGPSVARNTGIKAAGHEWIAFLDGDDEWAAAHLASHEGLLQSDPHLVWSTGNYIRCLCTTKRRRAHQTVERVEALLAGKAYFDDYFDAFLRGASGHPDTMVIRKDALVEAGLFREGLNRAEDMDMWFRIACRHGEIGFVAEPTAVYHLERQACLSKQFAPVELFRDLIARNLQFAAAAGRLAAFEPVASFLLRGWTRSMLFDARGEDIRALMLPFKRLLPLWYRVLMRILTSVPKLSSLGCRFISVIVRRLRLRRSLQRRPD